ncbi:putative ribonuclease H-like domain-containing protein [Tanacetum coccineum]
MEHYLSHTDYPIWEVIQKGNGHVSVSTDTNGVIKVLPPKTAEEILARERERKARTTLLMALPEDHLAKFHKMTDAKEMWDAIKSRFGGNDESKKMQKYILKQQFKGFSVSNSEGLHKGYDRDKQDVDNLSFDDLYNNLRVFESDVKGSTGSSSSAQNVAFVSSESTSSTNDVSTAYGVSTSSGYNSQRENSSSYNDELMYSFFANQSSGLHLDHEDLEQLNEFDLEEMDLKWQTRVECYNCHNTGHFARERRSIGIKTAEEENIKAWETLDIEQNINWEEDLETREPKALLVRSENQANKTTGPEEANHSAGTQDNVDAGNSKMEADPAQDYFVLPIYSSYTSTDKSSEAKNEGVDAMQEELLQFKIHKVWILVDLPYGKKAIVTKWVYRNKQDERDGCEGAFLYETIDEVVYVSQPPGFVDPKFPKKVYKVVKALYGLHQAPRAWYATLSTFLLKSGYRRGTIDKTLFIKKDKNDIMLVQVYVDDIIFGSTKRSWCDEFEALMKSRFQMSSMGELTFFLGLQVKQKEDGIFISQDKYVAEILKKFDFANVKTASTPIETQKPLTKDEEAADVDVHLYRSMIGSLMYLTASRPDIMFAVCACSRFQVTPKTSHLNVVKRIFRYLKGKPKLGLWYPRVSSFDLEAYSDSDYARANLDRKSTTGGCQFLGRRLISWQCKKQTIVATSTTEAEYVAAANCCGQVLWIQNQMLDYGFNFMNTKIYIDNESTICIVKNPVFHSKTKHIEIRHHFIRDAYEKKLIQVLKIHTDDNVADLLTKAFDVSRFNFLIVNIGMLNL